MLIFRITDNNGKTVLLKHPMSVSLSSSCSAPADSLRVVFAIDGSVPALHRIEAFDGDETVFSGCIDQQAEEFNSKGRFLTVYARSAAAVLLDNEARPQTYMCPSMRFLMKRHFEPLGFDRFIGPDRVFSGQFTVSKGMSEWAVLEKFATVFLNTEPKIDKSGAIDVSGNEGEGELFLPSESLISFRRELKNSSLISEIRARVLPDRGYDMVFRSEKADSCHVGRIRYVNTVEGRSGSIPGTKKLLDKSDSAYERISAECRGRAKCSVGDILTTDICSGRYRIREVNYTLDRRGERTKIYAEVKKA